MRGKLTPFIAGVALATFAVTPVAAARSTGDQATAHRYQTTTLVRGAPIHGANGLAIDRRGHLLVASGLGCQVDVLNRFTGRIVDRVGHGRGVDSPDDVAVGPDGSIYWTDFVLGAVGRLAPDGTVTKQTVAPGMNPIAFSPTGRLFVGQAFNGSALFELDPALVKPPKVVIANGTAPFPDQLNGFDFGSDGMLYAPQPFLSRIVKINPDTGALVPVATLPGPASSVEFDSHGRLYASLLGGTIARIDTATGASRVVATIRGGADLDNMVFDPQNRLFVSNSVNGAVYVVTLGSGVATRGHGVRTLSRGGLMLPGGIALKKDATGHRSLFVADMWRLVQLDPVSGRQLGVSKSSPAGGGIVTSWAVAPDGPNVIVSSWMANAVQVWNPATQTAVRTVTNVAVPLNALRFHGDLVVAQLGTGSVVRVDASGATSTIAGGFAVPAGLAARHGDLWVADQATGKVWKIMSQGVALAPPIVTASGLHAPEGMTVAPDGSLLVVEAAAHRLSRIDPMTGRVRTVASHLRLGMTGSAGAPPTWALSSVVVGGKGRIFVTGDIGDVVYRLDPAH